MTEQPKLHELFLKLQEELLAHLTTPRAVIPHQGAKGAATEARWMEMLKAHLPTRYCVTTGFVIDHTSAISDQIDVIIYDRHFSPSSLR